MVRSDFELTLMHIQLSSIVNSLSVFAEGVTELVSQFSMECKKSVFDIVFIAGYIFNLFIRPLTFSDKCVCMLLGIRSQSKPHDIMHEVYRAMKTLGYVSVVFFLAYMLAGYVNVV